MEKTLAGKKVAVLVANGFSETQFTDPQRALIDRGAQLRLVSPEPGLVNGWHETSWGHYFPVDEQIDVVLGSDYDILLVPGGKRSIDKLAQTPHTARIVKSFLDAGKPVVAVGEGVSILTIAERAKARRIACPEALRETLAAAEAEIQEDGVAVDGALVTAAGSDVIGECVEKMVALVEGTTSEMQNAA